MEVADKMGMKEIRQRTGWSQSKFAEHFGIPVRTLQQWEQGKSAPPSYVTRMIAYILAFEKIFDSQGMEEPDGKQNTEIGRSFQDKTEQKAVQKQNIENDLQDNNI